MASAKFNLKFNCSDKSGAVIYRPMSCRSLSHQLAVVVVVGISVVVSFQFGSSVVWFQLGVVLFHSGLRVVSFQLGVVVFQFWVVSFQAGLMVVSFQFGLIVV